ncbi:hypothetical protein D9M72_593320 [compost metagenome]
MQRRWQSTRLFEEKDLMVYLAKVRWMARLSPRLKQDRGLNRESSWMIREDCRTNVNASAPVASFRLRVR